MQELEAENRMVLAAEEIQRLERISRCRIICVGRWNGRVTALNCTFSKEMIEWKAGKARESRAAKRR